MNTTTGPQLPKYVSDAFGSPDRPGGNQGYLRSAYGAIRCHKFKPKNHTDDIFLAQILGHKLLGTETHPFLSDRVIRIFTFDSRVPELLGSKAIPPTYRIFFSFAV